MFPQPPPSLPATPGVSKREARLLRHTGPAANAELEFDAAVRGMLFK